MTQTRSFDLTETQQHHLELLQHLSSFGEALLLLTGEPKTGKTTLLDALEQSRQRPDETLTMNAQDIRQLSDVLINIADWWGVPTDSDDAQEILPALVTHAQSQYESGSTLLVIIDDADRLPEGLLKGLGVLGSVAPFALGVLLCGQLSLMDSFAGLIERGDLIAHHIALPSDSLHGALLTPPPKPASLDPDMTEKTPEPSAPQEPQQSSENETSAAVLPLRHIVIVAVLLAALLVYFLYSDDIASAFTNSTTSTTPEQNADTPEESSDTAKPAQEGAMDFNYNEPEPAGTPAAALPQAQLKAQPSQPKAEPVAEPKAQKPATPVKPANTNTKATPVKPETNAVAKPAPKPSAVESTVAPRSSAEPSKATQNKPQQPKAAVKTTKKTVSGAFVIQLFGSHSAQFAEDFKKRWEPSVAPAKLHIYQRMHQGKPWFTVVQGVHNNRDTANQARAKLPLGLKSQSPWVRSTNGLGVLVQ